MNQELTSSPHWLDPAMIDLVVAADIIYATTMFDALIEVLHFFVREQLPDSPKPKVLICFQRRKRYGEKFFELLQARGLIAVQIEDDVMLRELAHTNDILLFQIEKIAQ